MSQRIVIVGGGFVGLKITRLLSRTKRDASVLLIDETRDFLFTPWLIDALAGEMPLEKITVSLSKLAKQSDFTFKQGEVTRIDRGTRRVHVKSIEGNKDEVPYDILVLSQGVRSCYYGIPGAQENSFPLKNPNDVTRAQHAILEAMGKAAKSDDLLEREELLSVAVVGAGPTGIESIFAMKQFIERKQMLGALDATLKPRFHLIQGAHQILPGFPEAVIRDANITLDAQGIQTMTGEAVIKIDPGVIHTVSGKMIPASFILWSAGIEPRPIDIQPPVILDRGYIVVDNYFRVDDHIFCAGDMSGFKLHGAPLPKTAQTAMQMAPVLAKNILRSLAGKKLKAFHAKSKGVIITLGNTGVISLLHFITIYTRFTHFLRDLFYKHRFKQMMR
jgi:NADH dehydrogenase